MYRQRLHTNVLAWNTFNFPHMVSLIAERASENLLRLFMLAAETFVFQV